MEAVFCDSTRAEHIFTSHFLIGDGELTPNVFDILNILMRVSRKGDLETNVPVELISQNKIIEFSSIENVAPFLISSRKSIFWGYVANKGDSFMFLRQ